MDKAQRYSVYGKLTGDTEATILSEPKAMGEVDAKRDLTSRVGCMQSYGFRTQQLPDGATAIINPLTKQVECTYWVGAAPAGI